MPFNGVINDPEPSSVESVQTAPTDPAEEVVQEGEAQVPGEARGWFLLSDHRNRSLMDGLFGARPRRNSAGAGFGPLCWSPCGHVSKWKS